MPRQKPKKYKQPSLVSGLSIDDILNMDIVDFNRLSEKDLKLVVGRMVSAVNKRLRRFEKKGISTPATRALMKSGGSFVIVPSPLQSGFLPGAPAPGSAVHPPKRAARSW